MKTLLLSSFLVVGAFINTDAQPVIQMSDMMPNLGETYTSIESDYIEQDQEGAGQNWDFSSMTTGGAYTQTFLAPEGQPGSSNFPEATFVGSDDDGSAYSYIRLADNVMELLGQYVPGEDFLIDYTDPRTSVEFPLNFGDTYTDSYFYSTDLGSGVTTEEDGSATFNVTGYGTVTTPAGMFQNVLQVKMEANSVITNYFNGTVMATNVLTQDSYLYLEAGIPVAVASFSTVDVLGSETQIGQYFDGEVKASDGLVVADLELYPNPAAFDLNIRFQLAESGIVGLDLYTIDGKHVDNLISKQMPAGDISIRKNLPEVSAGMYLVQITTPDGVASQKVAISQQ